MPGQKRVGFQARVVLVVDDDADTADSMGLLLRLHGHQVRVAYSGDVALQMAQQQTPEVVLLDIAIPALDGFRVAEQLRERPEMKDCLIIAVTGLGQTSDRERSKKAGIDLHLLKPVDSEKLLLLLDGDPTLLLENLEPHPSETEKV